MGLVVGPWSEFPVFVLDAGNGHFGLFRGHEQLAIGIVAACPRSLLVSLILFCEVVLDSLPGSE